MGNARQHGHHLPKQIKLCVDFYNDTSANFWTGSHTQAKTDLQDEKAHHGYATGSVENRVKELVSHSGELLLHIAIDRARSLMHKGFTLYASPKKLLKPELTTMKICYFLAITSTLLLRYPSIVFSSAEVRIDDDDAATRRVSKYEALREDRGGDHVSMTKEAARLRSQYLRRKKPMLRKQAKLSSILFPGVSPEEYKKGEAIEIFAESVDSQKTQVPFEYFKLPVCQPPKLDDKKRRKHRRKSLGQRLMGYSTQPVSYEFQTQVDRGCTPLCMVRMGSGALKFIRKLVKDQYRIHFTLDGLPIIMRSAEQNYVVRGFPIGFVAPPGHGGSTIEELYLYNHLRFTVYYSDEQNPTEDDSTHTVRITGFDVHPVSIQHEIPEQVLTATDFYSEIQAKLSGIATCNPNNGSVLNDPGKYLLLKTLDASEALSVVYSYEVHWVQSDITVSLEWAVRSFSRPPNF